MKKTYSKAEALKVSFNANEQVAAACQYDIDDKTGSKYLGTVIGDLCGEYDNFGSGMKYGNADMAMCYIDDDGVSSYIAVEYEV